MLETKLVSANHLLVFTWLFDFVKCIICILLYCIDTLNKVK